MDLEILQKKLLAGKTVYILDDFEEAAIRLVYNNGKTTAFIRHKGRNEIKIPQSDETVCEIILSGNEVSKYEYYEY